MRHLSKFFYSKASWAAVIIFTILTFSYLFFVLMETAKGFQLTDKFESLATSYGLTIEVVQDFFVVRSAEMVEAFKSFNLIWDILFALLYGFMYTFWLSLVYKPFAQKVKLLNLLPFVQMVFDWLENGMMIRFSNKVLNVELITTSDVQIASIFSMAKWTCSGLVFVLLFVGVVWRIKRRFQH